MSVCAANSAFRMVKAFEASARTRVATATCKPQSRAACAIGRKCETKNQSSVTR
jgi:hypothetical protein